MDSLSQFALGAAIGEATLGRSLGRKALIVGGLLGTLPDLDVLVRYADAVDSFTYHRSWSHSLIILTLVSPVLAGLLHRYYPSRWLPKPTPNESGQTLPHFSNWLTCVFLVLITHALLDGFTLYGTQLLWPLPVGAVAWGSVFIIDPLYTLPLLAGIGAAIKSRRLARTAVITGLIISTLYLSLTLLSQRHARSVALESLAEQGLGTHNVLVAPAPFSVLWRIVSMENDTYHEGFYSLFDKDRHIVFNSFASNRALIDQHLGYEPIARLDWFTGGMISATRENDHLIINDLRMGVEASYVFRFKVGRLEGNELEPVLSEQMPLQMDTVRMGKIVRRALDEQINVEP